MKEAKSLIIIGIDPGYDGFFTRFMDGEVSFFEMPKTKDEEIDGARLQEIANDLIPINDDGDYRSYKIDVEDVHAKFGSAAASTFKFGFNVGKLHQALEGAYLEYDLIQPKAWQKDMWKGIERFKKPSKSGKTMVNDTKKISITAAQTIFPDLDLRRNKRCRTPHDGLCDSLLIAENCRRRHL